MSNKLEDFVKKHREELNAFEPSQNVWQKIDAGMQKPSFIKSKISWLKYFAYGASVIAVIVYFAMTNNRNSNKERSENHIALTAPIEQENKIDENQFNDQKPVAGKINQQSTDGSAEIIIPGTAKDDQKGAIEKQNDSLPLAIVNETKTNSAPMKNLSPSEYHKGKNFPLKMDTIFSGIKTLEISSPFDVNIKANSGDKVAFKANINSEAHGFVIAKGAADYKIKYERKDSVLKIVVVNKTRISIVVAGNYSMNAALYFEVPKAINLIINNSSGDIDADGLQGKVCNLETASGDIKVENINTDLKLESSSGNIKIVDVNGNVKMTSASGDITLENYKGCPVITTTSGNITGKNVELINNLTAESGSGNIKIIGMNGNVNMTSGSGDILLENYKGCPVLTTISGDITGKNVELVNNLTTETSSGNIKMNLVNDINDLSFDLQSSSGRLCIDKNGEKINQEGKLVVTKGKILIKGFTSSGDQSYK